MAVIFDVKINFLSSSLYIFLLICELPKQSVQSQVSNCQFNISTEEGTRFYDLNSLSRQSWRAKLSGESKESLNYVFISLCGNMQDHPCSDTQARICIRKQEDNHWNDVIANAGSVMQIWSLNNTERPKNGSLTVELTGGQKCDQVNYTTQINFLCSEGIGEPFVEQDGKCKLVVNWPTAAACPIVNASTKSCVLPLAHNLDTINLWPLRHMLYYQVPGDKGRVFRINMCDAVQQGHCGSNNTEAVAACEIDPKTNKTIAILGLAGRQRLSYSEKGLLLVYKAQNKKFTTEIEFVCNTSIQFDEPKFRWENNKTHYFEMKTSLACITPSKMECTVNDPQGYKYDLSELSKSQKSWYVSDNRPGYEDVKYYISVCKPLSISSECADGTTGVCQITTRKGMPQTSLNLGQLGVGPQIIGNENQLVLHYSGGSPCQNGKFRRRTVILFQCAREEEMPVFINESPDCVYSFQWAHPAACRKKSVIGKNCAVMEPEYSHVFNVSSIYNPNKDYEMFFDDSTIRINLCGPLLKPCNKSKNVSVCLEKNGKQFAIGELATKLLYEEGRVSFELAGQGCKEGKNSSTVYMIFLCNHSVKNAIPEMFPEDDNCNFYFVWPSNLTCPPYKESSCHTFDDQNQKYDLSELSDPSGNYIVLHNTSYGYVKFLLNVCRSVVFGYDATCEHNSGICLYNMTAPNNQDNYINLGDVSDQGLHFENGMLQITYTLGDVCRDPSQSGHISSKIVFICDRDELNNTGPKFVKLDKCQYNFEWRTKHACSVASMIAEPKLDQGACKVTSPISKFQFDLNSLTKKEFTANTSDGDFFKIAVCGSLKSCGHGSDDGTGSCYKKNGTYMSAGMGNSELNIRTGSLFLNYTNGKECAPGIKSNTLIEFVCSPQNTTSGPKYVDITSQCSYVIQWFTVHACEDNIRCMAQDNDKQIDLSPFMSNSSNYKTTANGSDFFINVCHPLLPVEGLNCAGGSGACMAQEGPKGTWVEELSLGFNLFTPVIIEGNVILKYMFGSPCLDTKGLNISSSFNFTCDPSAGLGNPVFESYTHDCQYQFLWKSSVICDDYESEVQNTCILYNENNNLTVDLTPLHREESYKIQNFELKMCNTGNFTALSQHVEGKELSYGRVQSFVFSYKNNVTKLFFHGGDKCTLGSNSDTYTAEMRLRCDAVDQAPKVSIMLQCKVVLDWRTPAACIGAKAAQSNYESSDILAGTVSHVSTAGVVIGVLLAFIFIGLLVMYLRKPANRNRCRSHLCCFVGKQHHGQFHYSRLEATDEASILLANHSDGVESDSDDELLRT